MTLRTLLIGIILLISAACQPTLVTQPPPTVMQLATNTPTQPPTLTPTMTASRTPSPTSTASPTLTPSPTLTTSPSPSPTQTLSPRPPLPAAFRYGQSVEGRDLLARTFGSGPQLIMLVGGIHTGYEANTVTLINEMIAHFERAPGDVLPQVTLLLIPVANPDGLTRGRSLSGRFNANGVDLNRNWDCEWSAEAVWQERSVNPGAAPFSEPETLALAALINDLRPQVVLFYHAAARGVFAGGCNGVSHSQAMAEVLGQAAGYPYGQPFEAYNVTGTEANWVDSLGIPSADVELATSTESELIRNLRGVRALQCWLAGC